MGSWVEHHSGKELFEYQSILVPGWMMDRYLIQRVYSLFGLATGG